MFKTRRHQEKIRENLLEMTAGLSLTERCNLRCKHCYIGKKDLWREQNYKPKEISFKQIKKIIPELKKANVKRINLGGGETPLHKDFIPIVQELYNAGLKISLTTNGTTYNIYKNYLHLFNDIGISIDFPDKRHCELRGREGVFEKAIETLRNLVGKGVKTELVTCIMSLNCKELPQIYNLAKNLGVDMWRLNRFHSSINDLERFQNNGSINKNICRINANLSCSQEQLKKAFEYLASLTPKKQTYTISDPLFRTYVEGCGVVKGNPSGKIALE